MVRYGIGVRRHARSGAEGGTLGLRSVVHLHVAVGLVVGLVVVGLLALLALLGLVDRGEGGRLLRVLLAVLEHELLLLHAPLVLGARRLALGRADDVARLVRVRVRPRLRLRLRLRLRFRLTLTLTLRAEDVARLLDRLEAEREQPVDLAADELALRRQVVLAVGLGVGLGLGLRLGLELG